jgi:uncharacterized protein YxjI
MFRRRARQSEDTPEEAPAGTRYLLREKLLTFGNDLWVENERGEPIFRVDDKVLRVRDTYGLAVVPGQNDALVLAVTVCIDHLTEHDHEPPGRGRRGRPRRPPWPRCRPR